MTWPAPWKSEKCYKCKQLLGNTKYTRQLVDHLFRHEHGKMVAILSHAYGIGYLEMIEDAIQEAFFKALRSWSFNQVPDHPSAWLLTVAKNQLRDHFRQRRTHQQHLEQGITLPESETSPDLVYHPKEVADSQLRLIFACCDPVLKQEDQVALTLKTISGFSIKEIASSLLLAEETIKKRLQRARRTIAQREDALQIPTGQELGKRLHTVHTILYLLFNEGYHSLKTDELIRKELCAEAMRLCKLLHDHPECQSPATTALLSLMCFHAARFESRLDEDQQIVLLQDQDRSRWSQELIQLGHFYLQQAASSNKLDAYQIEAAIAGYHCMAPSFAETNWTELHRLYEILLQFKSNSVILLNLVVVLIQLHELEKAHLLFNQLHEQDFSGRVYLYFAVGAELFTNRMEREKATAYLHRAISTTQSQSEKELLRLKLQQLLGNTSFQ